MSCVCTRLRGGRELGLRAALWTSGRRCYLSFATGATATRLCCRKLGWSQSSWASNTECLVPLHPRTTDPASSCYFRSFCRLLPSDRSMSSCRFGWSKFGCWSGRRLAVLCCATRKRFWHRQLSRSTPLTSWSSDRCSWAEPAQAVCPTSWSRRGRK